MNLVRRRTLAKALAAASGVLVLAACGSAEPAPGAEAGVAYAHYVPEGSGGDDGLLTGKVDEVDGCLVVIETDTGTVYTPVFPEGAEIPSPGDRASLPGGAHDAWPGLGDTDGCEVEPFWLVSPAA